MKKVQLKYLNCFKFKISLNFKLAHPIPSKFKFDRTKEINHFINSLNLHKKYNFYIKNFELKK